MYERSRILVDPKVQWTIAGRLAGHWTMFLVCLVAISTLVRVIFTAGDQPLLDSAWSSLKAQTPIILVMLMLLPVFLRDSLKLSNRFAGPMYRLRTALRSLAQNKETGPIKFRTGDFWLEAADDFNIVLAQLEELKSENTELKRKIEESASVFGV
ncbi:hypothetical protein [Rubripirellula reticaptiva]|uniref:HAMP domain-containing protein n=1 Tax=Rubripirellula reticaptiva TaxID=2528013 RepID=A0A5C6EWX0_9BACT|nr:hypothetical protein [Rubripirellula reticaptiva]TWU51959.1 hypothetical protein Poly59_35560 [Rubripirellula reticaptiva]